MRRHIVAALFASMIAALAAAPLLGAQDTEKAAPFPAVGTYEGVTYPSEAIVTQGLSCNVMEASLACYDSEKEADAAAMSRLSSSGQVVALATCSPPLRVYWDPYFAGSSLAYYDYPGWQNLPSSWRNQVSSFATGCRPGALSDLVGGGGAQFSAGAGAGWQTLPGFDNRADAIYRG